MLAGDPTLGAGGGGDAGHVYTGSTAATTVRWRAPASSSSHSTSQPTIQNNHRGTEAMTLCSGGLAVSRAFWASDFASASNWPCWVLGLACAMDDDGEVWLHRKKSKTKMPLMAAPLPAKRRALGAGTGSSCSGGATMICSW
jgi:hypothetical protein